MAAAPTTSEPITAMIAGPQDRFFTGSSDAHQELAAGQGGATGHAQGRCRQGGRPGRRAGPRQAAGGGGLRRQHAAVLPTRRGGQVRRGDRVTFHGADAWAKNELAQSDPKRREAALRTLAGFADAAAIKRIAAQMSSDADHALRLLACQLLGESAHPRAAKALEKGLDHRDEAVRLLAFEGLRRHAGPTRPAAVGPGPQGGQGRRRRARRAGAGGAGGQGRPGAGPARRRRCRRRRSRYGGRRWRAWRRSTAPTSPEASLTALGTPHADLRRLALLRLFQRLLHDPRVQAALRGAARIRTPRCVASRSCCRCTRARNC